MVEKLLADMLREVKDALGLTQAQFAEALGVNLDRIKSLTSGKVAKLSQAEAKAMVENLHVNPAWLATGEGEMFQTQPERAFAGELATLRQATDAVTSLPISDEKKVLVRDILFAVASGKSDLIDAAVDRVASEATCIPPHELVMVPRYDVRASAGGGALIHSELIVDYLAFRQEWVSKMGLIRKKLALIEVQGDSMEPALQNDDLVLIDLRVSGLAADGIYVLQHRGHLLVKRIQCKFDGSVVIKSDNPAYESEVLKPDEAETLIVVGRVVWFGRAM